MASKSASGKTGPQFGFESVNFGFFRTTYFPGSHSVKILIDGDPVAEAFSTVSKSPPARFSRAPAPTYLAADAFHSLYWCKYFFAWEKATTVNAPSTRLPASHADQDQLREIYLAGGEETRVRMGKLSEILSCPPASVTAAIKRLHEAGFVQYEPYQGALLTAAGAEAAVELVRHHRLIERFLVQILGYDWDDVHEEADRLEHAISEKLEGKIADILSNPTADPHGEPIPGADLQAVADESYALAEAEVSERLKVVRVHDRDPELLKYLAEIGLVPGARVRVLEHLPFEGPLVISLGGKSLPVGLPVAEAVFVNSSSG